MKAGPGCRCAVVVEGGDPVGCPAAPIRLTPTADDCRQRCEPQTRPGPTVTQCSAWPTSVTRRGTRRGRTMCRSGSTPSRGRPCGAVPSGASGKASSVPLRSCSSTIKPPPASRGQPPPDPSSRTRSDDVNVFPGQNTSPCRGACCAFCSYGVGASCCRWTFRSRPCWCRLRSRPRRWTCRSLSNPHRGRSFRRRWPRP